MNILRKLFPKKVWILEGIEYDEQNKRFKVTAVFGVHKDRNWALAHLHQLGYLNGKLFSKPAIDEFGMTRIGAHVMYDSEGNLARAREVTLEK